MWGANRSFSRTAFKHFVMLVLMLAWVSASTQAGTFLPCGDKIRTKLRPASPTDKVHPICERRGLLLCGSVVEGQILQGGNCDGKQVGQKCVGPGGAIGIITNNSAGSSIGAGGVWCGYGNECLNDYQSANPLNRCYMGTPRDLQDEAAQLVQKGVTVDPYFQTLVVSSDLTSVQQKLSTDISDAKKARDKFKTALQVWCLTNNITSKQALTNKITSDSCAPVKDLKLLIAKLKADNFAAGNLLTNASLGSANQRQQVGILINDAKGEISALEDTIAKADCPQNPNKDKDGKSSLSGPGGGTATSSTSTNNKVCCKNGTTQMMAKRGTQTLPNGNVVAAPYDTAAEATKACAGNGGAHPKPFTFPCLIYDAESGGGSGTALGGAPIKLCCNNGKTVEGSWGTSFDSNTQSTTAAELAFAHDKCGDANWGASSNPQKLPCVAVATQATKKCCQDKSEVTLGAAASTYTSACQPYYDYACSTKGGTGKCKWEECLWTIQSHISDNLQSLLNFEFGKLPVSTTITSMTNGFCAFNPQLDTAKNLQTGAANQLKSVSCTPWPTFPANVASMASTALKKSKFDNAVALKKKIDDWVVAVQPKLSACVMGDTSTTSGSSSGAGSNDDDDNDEPATADKCAGYGTKKNSIDNTAYECKRCKIISLTPKYKLKRSTSPKHWGCDTTHTQKCCTNSEWQAAYQRDYGQPGSGNDSSKCSPACPSGWECQKKLFGYKCKETACTKDCGKDSSVICIKKGWYKKTTGSGWIYYLQDSCVTQQQFDAVISGQYTYTSSSDPAPGTTGSWASGTDSNGNAIPKPCYTSTGSLQTGCDPNCYDSSGNVKQCCDAMGKLKVCYDSVASCKLKPCYTDCALKNGYNADCTPAGPSEKCKRYGNDIMVNGIVYKMANQKFHTHTKPAPGTACANCHVQGGIVPGLGSNTCSSHTNDAPECDN